MGCSGWQYDDWRGRFYPRTLPRYRWLEYYAQAFDTVELNGTFYKLSERSVFEGWAARVPEDFLFLVKASRYLTHLKKLKEPQEPIARLFDRLVGLGHHLGPVLYQLPPLWRLNRARLVTFLQALPRDARHVVELRETSWYALEVLETLARHGVSLCVHDFPGSASGLQRVGPCVYVRLHGSVRKYHGAYGVERLVPWADWLHAQREQGFDVYVAFNNDTGGEAPRDAYLLRTLLERRAAVAERGKAG